MVNDRTFQLRYLWILFGLSIAQLIFLYDLSRTESGLFATAMDQTSNDNEKAGNQGVTAVGKDQNCTKTLLN